jgi:hypothetical protein
MQLAEAAQDPPAYKRCKRMEAAWLALAEEQDWLDGENHRSIAPRRRRENDYEDAADHCYCLLFSLCCGSNCGAEGGQVATSSETKSSDGL